MEKMMQITFDPYDPDDLERLNDTLGLVGYGLVSLDQVEGELPEPEEEAPVKPKKTRTRSKKAPEPEPEEEEEEEEEEIEVGLEDLQEQAAEILANLGRPVLAAALKKLKTKSLSAMDPEDYSKAHIYLQSLIDGEED